MTGGGAASLALGSALATELRSTDLDTILRHGLREFLQEFLGRNAAISGALATDYHFD
jgi:hypothetical protein